MYNKSDARELYYDVVKEGLWKMQSRIDRKLRAAREYKAKCKENCWAYTTEHHYIFELKRSSNFLYSLEREYKHLFYKRMVGSGSVNHGESWGDFYEMFPINNSNNEAVIKLFNEFQKETPFGYYLEIKIKDK